MAACTAAQAGELIAALQGALAGAGVSADARAAVWAAFARQDPALLAAFPTGLRSQSARLLTDLLAAAAVVGDLLGIRPIISLNAGVSKVEAKVRGDAAVPAAMIKWVESRSV